MKQSLVKSAIDAANLRRSGQILSEALRHTAASAREGVSLLELDRIAEQAIVKGGGRPSFKGFNQYPFASCLSVNNAVVHGLPKEYTLQENDSIGIDLGVAYQGWYTDAATTVAIGRLSGRKQRLLQATKEALAQAAEAVKPGARVGEIGAAVQTVATRYRFGIVKALTGHGIGRALHEPPSIPNWGTSRDGPILKEGQVLAIEPMFCQGSGEVTTAPDGWSVLCTDGPGSHHEATVLVTATGHELITEII